MAHRGSLPDMWGIPPEHGAELEINRLNLKADFLDIEMRDSNRQMGSLLNLMQRNHEGEISRNLQREIT